jgi:MutS domain III
MEIHARQNLVSLFYAKHHLRDDLVQLLKRLEDASRIVQRFLLGKGDVTDLSTIKNAIDTWEEIKSRIELEHQMDLQGKSTGAGDEWLDLRRLLNRMADLTKLAWRIGMAVDTSALSHSDEADPESLTSSAHDGIRTNLTTSSWTGQLKTAIRPKSASMLHPLSNLIPSQLFPSTRLAPCSLDRRRGRTTEARTRVTASIWHVTSRLP